MVISHVLIGFIMTRSPSMLIKGARLCLKESLYTASIGVQYCGDMVARGPPKHQSNWNFLAFSEPAHQMEPKNASGAMECPHSCNLGHPIIRPSHVAPESGLCYEPDSLGVKNHR